MLDPAIKHFLDERKELWLKKKIKSKTTEEEKILFEKQAAVEFSLPGWLPGAAKRASQLSLVSHPGKFSHPSAKTTPIIALSPSDNDGFLRTGNVTTVDLDVLGNAAALDVFKFLSIKLVDNKTILTHLDEKTSTIKEQLSIPTLPFPDVEQGLLAVKEDTGTTVKTSNKIKQVYFPADSSGYHLLSVLTPSGVMYKLKERINQMRFSEAAKEVRAAKKANKDSPDDLSEIYGLSVIGFGGTKPQNISVLNSQNGGAAYLLPSMPPNLTPRTIYPPKVNFFSNSLWPRAFIDDYQKFHDVLIADANNVHVRRQRDWLIRSIIYQVADRMWMIRSLPGQWSDAERYQALPHYQKIWLDQQYRETRQEDGQWFDQVKINLARWFILTYKKLLAKKALSLGDEHSQPIKDMIVECEEALR